MDENDAINMLMQDLMNRPGGKDRIVQGFTRRTQLTPQQEIMFRAQATAMGHDPKMLDDPTYDMRGAWLVGELHPPTQHGSSQFKGLGDDRMFLPIGANNQLLDTRTAQPGIGGDVGPWQGPKPDPQLLDLWHVISGVMNEK